MVDSAGHPTTAPAVVAGRGAAAYLDRYNAPILSDDDTVVRHSPPEPLAHGDARDMGDIKDGSVALVVTAPPAFVGPYEITEPGDPAVLDGYVAYMDMLRDVFAECVRVLEPGGRMAVNVANLGRKPYRSLSADVIGLLQDDLGLLIRGEVIWMKARGAGSNCAWGSYRSPKNPVLRDVTERVILAGKGRFDRAVDAASRKAAGLPHAITLTSDEFQEATLDFWEIPPEAASEVDHPSPFPVALPQRLVELYTYADDLVLDPFMGSGTTAVAAVRSGRRFAGYDVDPGHVATARRRVEAEQAAHAGRVDDPVTLAFHEARVRGSAMRKLLAEVLAEVGFTGIREEAKVAKVSLVAPAAARDASGRRWLFEMSGAFTVVPTGLDWVDAALAAVGRGAVIAGATGEPPILFVPQLPEPKSPVDVILRAAGPSALFDVVEVFSPEGRRRLARYASGTVNSPLPGFWTEKEVAVEAS
ncbi:MAG TPA: site-specific DNA-methyltransferase [Acidimicrobiales bacterium]|nr:site-specific DNA-methyltransferase [Acidimicrobiales bacterium]